jgi:hypothetical protein
MEVSLLSHGMMLPKPNPYPPDYRMAFASSIFLYPHPYRLVLRLAFPEGGIRAYHVPHVYPDGLGPASSPVARHLRQAIKKHLRLTTYLLVQACQHLWLVPNHDVYRRFTYVDHTIQL